MDREPPLRRAPQAATRGGPALALRVVRAARRSTDFEEDEPVNRPLSALIILAAAVGCTGGGDKLGTPPSEQPAADATRREMKEVKPSADYPLTKCVISGEDLGPVADRIAYSYGGTEVQFCCPGCVGKFEKDPAPYLAKIRAAAK
jgi:hypothetical protein